MAGMTSAIQEASTLEALEALRGRWEEAQAACAPDDVFATFEWSVAWWRHFGAGRRLRVLVVPGAATLSFFPLWEGPIWGRWAPLRKVQMLGTGLADRLQPLLCGEALELAERALRHLLAGRRSWDVLDLREVPEDSPAVAGLREAAARCGLDCEVTADSESLYLPIDTDWETFLATRLGSKSRKRIRHNANRLDSECGPVSITFDAVPGGSSLVARLAAVPQYGQYRGAERRSIFSTPAKQAFFQEVAERFAARGWLRVSLLECKGDLAAFRFAFQYAGRYLDYFTGYHLKYAKVSPGAVLLARVVEECFRQGLREVDFLRGIEPWKEVWTDRRRRNLRVRIYRPGLRRAALRLLYGARARFARSTAEGE